MTKKEIEKTMRLSGKVRGVAFQADAAYVREKKGEEGLKLLEQKTKEWGHPINYSKVSAVRWYPISLRVLSLLTMKETFGWGDEEIKDLGDFSPRHSFLLKVIGRHFLSLRRSFNESAKFWRIHYSVGAIEPYEFNEKERYAILHLKDFKIHPALCAFYCGYMRRLCQFSLRTGKATVEETKCMFSGDPYHEFVIRWK